MERLKKKEMEQMLLANHWVRHEDCDNHDLGWQELTEALLQSEQLEALYLQYASPTPSQLKALLSMRPSYRKRFMVSHLIMTTLRKGQLEELASELENDNFRICDHCGLPHIHGYIIGDCGHYCTQNCLVEASFSEADIDGDENYYTEYGR